MFQNSFDLTKSTWTNTGKKSSASDIRDIDALFYTLFLLLLFLYKNAVFFFGPAEYSNFCAERFFFFLSFMYYT